MIHKSCGCDSKWIAQGQRQGIEGGGNAKEDAEVTCGNFWKDFQRYHHIRGQAKLIGTLVTGETAQAVRLYNLPCIVNVCQAGM